jgi:bisphosphoglycerate-independent phosphoglycerate mutase (AlkP superfamily)
MSVFDSVKAHFSPVVGMAKRYYKIRLHVLEQGDKVKRSEALNILNQVQPALNTLEMGNVSSMERGRFLSQIQAAVENVEHMLKSNQSQNPQQGMRQNPNFTDQRR